MEEMKDIIAVTILEKDLKEEFNTREYKFKIEELNQKGTMNKEDQPKEELHMKEDLDLKKGQ